MDRPIWRSYRWHGRKEKSSRGFVVECRHVQMRRIGNVRGFVLPCTFTFAFTFAFTFDSDISIYLPLRTHGWLAASNHEFACTLHWKWRNSWSNPLLRLGISKRCGLSDWRRFVSNTSIFHCLLLLANRQQGFYCFFQNQGCTWYPAGDKRPMAHLLEYSIDNSIDLHEYEHYCICHLHRLGCKRPMAFARRFHFPWSRKQNCFWSLLLSVRIRWKKTQNYCSARMISDLFFLSKNRKRHMIQLGVPSPSPLFAEGLSRRQNMGTNDFVVSHWWYDNAFQWLSVFFSLFQSEVQFGICLQVARHITRTSTRRMNWWIWFNSHMITTMITMGNSALSWIMDRFTIVLTLFVCIVGSFSKWAMERASSSPLSMGPGHQEVDVSIPFNFEEAMLMHIYYSEHYVWN